MKEPRRWLALLLAATLVCSNAAYSLSTSLHANEENIAQEVHQMEGAGQEAGTGIDVSAVKAVVP